MNAKDLERLLAAHGANASAVDVVVRRLRESFRVSTGGRGLNAHHLSSDEVAWIVVAYAGSEVAARAATDLARLLELSTDQTRPAEASAWSSDFVTAFQLIMHGELKDVREVRIARNANFASILFEEHGTINFRSPKTLVVPGFRSEAVISTPLINALVEQLASRDEAG